MIYTDLTKKAMKLAYNAHHGQLDRSGIPYICHPLHLAEMMDDEVACTVALLHDVVEDTQYSMQDLEKEFPSEVIEALKLLTHDKSVDYFEYVKAVKANPTAKKVKIADVMHNSDESRLDSISEKDLKRREKYRKAIALLKDE